MSEIRWPNGAGVPLSVCSQACELGDVKEPRNDAPEKCCWKCVTCKKYHVILNNTCRACAQGHVPDANFSSCLKLEVKSMNLGKPVAVFLALFAFLGLVTNLAALAIFYTNRNHQLVKATNMKACYFIFCGIFLIFLTPVAFLIRPTQTLCYAQRFLLGNAFAIGYAALLVKLRRIYDLSKRENQLQLQVRGNVYLFGLRSDNAITITIIIIQLLLTVLITVKDPSKLRENFYLNPEELILECPINSPPFVAYIAGSLILVFLCTGYAFLTRNVPKNFRETLCISITTYLSNVLWVLLLACFLNIEKSFSRQYLVAGMSLVIGWITLLGLFAPVFYHLRTKKNFDRASLIDWDDSGARRLHGGNSQASLFPTPQLGIVRKVETLAQRSSEKGTGESYC